MTDTTPTANTLYPCLPNYKGKTEGFFTCPHHNHLIEYHTDILERKVEIPEVKPEEQVRIRYEHIVYVPEELVPKYVKAAREKYYAAREKAVAAREKFDAAREKFRAAWWKVNAAVEKYRAAWEKYTAALNKANKNRTLTKYLHDHVKNCLWNGEEIDFSKSL
jgi:hypothetical protein